MSTYSALPVCITVHCQHLVVVVVATGYLSTSQTKFITSDLARHVDFGECYIQRGTSTQQSTPAKVLSGYLLSKEDKERPD
jgi:hypothetical protein